jgi:hypothetical protein
LKKLVIFFLKKSTCRGIRHGPTAQRETDGEEEEHIGGRRTELALRPTRDCDGRGRAKHSRKEDRTLHDELLLRRRLGRNREAAEHCGRKCLGSFEQSSALSRGAHSERGAEYMHVHALGQREFEHKTTIVLSHPAKV